MKYFVFDVDGTLMNSAAVDQQCLKQTLHEFGRDYTFEELRPCFGMPGRQTLADLGFTGETAERIMDRWEGLSKERASEVLAFDGIEALLRELHSVDPEAAARLHPADEKRIIRALEVWQETGRTITEHNRETQKIPPRYAPVWLGLDFTNRADLYARIDRRVEIMLEQGLLDEIRSLLTSGVPETATSLQAIGYKELLGYLSGEQTLEECTELLKRRSRNYAKRQLT